ncbi:hypothetical protein IWZ03DRAFT_365599 [Phyllosticta citriasiana]|uniref:Secreted protein n=1 Tax=Phyllosticta citriasiana TaxID=595635 RepID=A0ABR1KY91_9PEZI
MNCLMLCPALFFAAWKSFFNWFSNIPFHRHILDHLVSNAPLRRLSGRYLPLDFWIPGSPFGHLRSLPACRVGTSAHSERRHCIAFFIFGFQDFRISVISTLLTPALFTQLRRSAFCILHCSLRIPTRHWRVGVQFATKVHCGVLYVPMSATMYTHIICTFLSQGKDKHGTLTQSKPHAEQPDQKRRHHLHRVDAQLSCRYASTTSTTVPLQLSPPPYRPHLHRNRNDRQHTHHLAQPRKLRRNPHTVRKSARSQQNRKDIIHETPGKVGADAAERAYVSCCGFDKKTVSDDIHTFHF